MRAGVEECASPAVDGPSFDKPGEARAARYRCRAYDSHMEGHMQWIAERNENCEPVDFEESQPVDFEETRPPCVLDPVGGQARARGRLAPRRPMTRTTRRVQARRARLARAAE
jgi:hypothetical protein